VVVVVVGAVIAVALSVDETNIDSSGLAVPVPKVRERLKAWLSNDFSKIPSPALFLNRFFDRNISGDGCPWSKRSFCVIGMPFSFCNFSRCLPSSSKLSELNARIKERDEPLLNSAALTSLG